MQLIGKYKDYWDYSCEKGDGLTFVREPISDEIKALTKGFDVNSFRGKYTGRKAMKKIRGKQLSF